LGWAVRNILDRFVGTALGCKCSGCQLARFLLSVENHAGDFFKDSFGPSFWWLGGCFVGYHRGYGYVVIGLAWVSLLPEMMEVVLETVDTGTGPLGVSIVRMDKNGVEPEGFNGVSGGLRKAREELAPAVSPALSSSRGGSVPGPSLPSVFPGFSGFVVGLSETSSLLPALETSSTHTDSFSSAEMDEKLTSEWEIDVKKKVAGFWERLSQEYAGNVSEEHNERFRAITEEMIKRQKTKGKKELLNLQSSVNYGTLKFLLGVGKAKPM